MKYFNLSYIYTCLFVLFISIAPAGSVHSKAAALQITPEDMAALEGMGFSKEEVQEMAREVNSLTPEQQESLLQETQKQVEQLQERALKSNVNLEDPNELLNFISQEYEGGDHEAQPKKGSGQKLELPAQPAETTPNAPAKSLHLKTNAQTILRGIAEHIASLRQKAHSKEAFSHRLEGRFKQELDELVYYTNLLNKPELITYLISKDFTGLYTTLEQLYTNLRAYEPRVVTELTFEKDEAIDDPYEILDIPYTATAQEITARFNQLKQQYDPALLERRLTKERVADRDRKRLLKQARLTFDPIKTAYQSLKDPKEKNQIDRTLSQRITTQKQAQAGSQRAFDSVLQGMSNAIYNQKVIQSAQGLLTKYAPEEKKKADEWEKQKKAAWDLSKRDSEAANRRAQTAQRESQIGHTSARTAQEETGERFYRDYKAPAAPQAPAFNAPTISPENKPNFGSPSKVSDKPEKPADKKGKEAPKGKEGDKKDDKDKGKDKEKTKAGEPGAPLSNKSPKQLQSDQEGAWKEMHDKELEKLKKGLQEPDSKPESLKHLFNVELPAYLALEHKAAAAEKQPVALAEKQTAKQTNAAPAAADYAALSHFEQTSPEFMALSDEHAQVVDQLAAVREQQEQLQALAQSGDNGAQQVLAQAQAQVDELTTKSNALRDQMSSVVAQFTQAQKSQQAPAQAAQPKAGPKDPEQALLESVHNMMTTYKLQDIALDFDKLYKRAQNKDAKQLEIAALWQDITKKYKGTIDELKKLTDSTLDAVGASNAKRRIHQTKLALHQLEPKKGQTPEQAAKARAKNVETPENEKFAAQKGYLGFVKNVLEQITDRFSKITKTLASVSQSAAKPKAPAKESKEADEKEPKAKMQDKEPAAEEV